MRLTLEQYRLLPSDSDVEFYNLHGYYVAGQIFSDEEIDEAIRGSERFYAGERDFHLHQRLKPFKGWKIGDGEVLRINDYVSLQNREIADLAHHPLIGAIAARLCGSSTIRLWHDQMIYKPVDESCQKTTIGWHTDRAYWKTCSSVDMLTAWVPFSDCEESMGPLVVIDGSHRREGFSELRGFHNHNPSDSNAGFETLYREFDQVSLNLKKRQVSFHHCLTIHGSRPNRSNVRRLSLSVHLQDGSNQYCEYRDSEGEIVWHRNDLLCRTVDDRPDYADADICPVLWREEPSPTGNTYSGFQLNE